MGFLNTLVFGVRLWLILYLAFSIIAFVGVIFYIKREQIRKKYYQLRYSEKLLKVVVHYKSNMYKTYWRIIPDKRFFQLGGAIYNYEDKNVLKEHDFFAKKQKGKQTISAEGNEYNLIDELKIKDKGRKYPEIHYYYGNPSPINFDFSHKKTDLSATQLKEWKENDLFSKLLTLQEEKNLLTMILLLNIGIAVGVLVVIGKLMEWF